MGQIAACLTDLICLIEQRDAFGFTSPSKAADSASVKKKREGRERERETPPRHFHSDRRPFAHTPTASGGLYLLALNFFFAAARHGRFQVIGRQQWPPAWKICQLSPSLIRSGTQQMTGVRWSQLLGCFGPGNDTADPISPQNPEHGSLKGPYIHSLLRSPAHYSELPLDSTPFLRRGLRTQRRGRLSLCLI